MSFSISIIKNPVSVWDQRRQCEIFNWDEAKGDHNLNFVIDGKDFDEIQKIVDVSLPPTKQLASESCEEFDNRIKEEYLKAASEKGYEMLGRFWFWYADVVYFSPEVNRFREECLNAKNSTQNQDAINALNKVIAACNEAIKTNSGILFGCD